MKQFISFINTNAYPDKLYVNKYISIPIATNMCKISGKLKKRNTCYILANSIKTLSIQIGKKDEFIIYLYDK